MLDYIQFIKEVEKRPALFDPMSHDYNNKAVREQCWSEIGALVYENWSQLSAAKKQSCRRELTKKWKDLRDTFVRDRRKIRQSGSESILKRSGVPSSRSVYQKHMHFLIPFIRSAIPAEAAYRSNVSHTAKTEISVDDYMEEEEDDISQQKQDPNDPLGTLRIKNETNEHHVAEFDEHDESNTEMTFDDTSILSQKIEEPDSFGHKAFLLSYLPAMNSLPPRLAMEARTKISQVFLELMDKSHKSAA